MMTIEEYRAAIFQALLDAKNEDGTPAITPKEAQESFGIHQKTWLKSYSKDKNTSKYSVKKRIMEFMIRFFHLIRFILIAANAIEL